MPEQNILLQTLDARWQRHGSESGLRTALVYLFVLTTCGLAIWLTLSLGSGLRTDAGRGSVVSPVAVRLDYQSGIQTIARILTANLRQPLGILLLQLILIIVAARLLGSLSLKIGQPRVIGEMVARILLGPSFSKLLPLFFAFTGLRTQITLLGNSSLWLICAFVIGIAIVGKLGASMLAARLSRFEWREAFALGALMNTRGLMELVVLNIGLDLGILSAPLFAIMVLMALVTTFMTAPLVSLARIEQDTAD